MRSLIPREHAGAIAAGCAVAAIFMLPAAAAGHPGDGVFTLAEGRWLGGRDIVMLRDGSVVGTNGWRAWRLTTDGRRRAIRGLSGTGVVAAPGGGVLAIQGVEPRFFPGDGPPQHAKHQVVRWTARAGVSVVAGSGRRGFAGDGGPATAARLNLGASRYSIGWDAPTGLVTHRRGGFAFADTANGRIRSVGPDGIIRTIAGAKRGTFRDPLALARMPGGGYLVGEGGWPGFGEDGLTARLRRLAADGTVETVANHMVVQDLAVPADGAPVLSSYGELYRLDRGSGLLSAYLRPADPAETVDFAARTVAASHLGLDRHGGLIAGGGRVLTYVPGGRTPWTLAALRGATTSDRGLTAVVEATRPGRATLEVANRERVVARVTKRIGVGHSTLRAAGPIADEWYTLRLHLKGAHGSAVPDAVPIHGARALTVPLARELLGPEQGVEGADDEQDYQLGSECRQFGDRRVDCVIEHTDGINVGVASVTLEASGVVLRRGYEWTDAGFQADPEFIDTPGVHRISRGDGGSWQG